jgi:hypothetical protein
MGRASLLVSLLAVTNCAFAAPPSKKWLGETRKENGVSYQCKCYSDNECWPSKAKWNALNTTVDGALKTALPPAASCHRSVAGVPGSTYDAATCAKVTENWTNEQFL